MKKRILKKARIQLQICIPLLCIGILAAGVLIVKNLSWAEISMAAVGILIGIYGLYGILDAGNFCIAYDDEEIMVRDFRRKQKNFIIRIWKGSVFRTILRRSSSTLKTAGSCLMMRPREKNVSSRLQRENIQNIIVDKECRNLGKDPDIQSFLSCLPFGVCAWHVWGSLVYFRREKKQNFMDRFMWSHSSNTLKT